MRHATLTFLALTFLFFAAAAQVQGSPLLPDDALLPGNDHPLGAWEGAPPPQPSAALDALWSLRTGFRKGVQDQTLPEEIYAAPDVAVLRYGLFTAWGGLLAGFQEPSILVEPDDLAGLSRTKPVLIIPSGGLAGLASSIFFRAGLAEFAGSGGVVLCFSQQKGDDLAALPLPGGAKLEGAGWSEDSGPLFRASTTSAIHPAIIGLKTAAPLIETDGYVTAHPPNATVLLSRSDGRPTVLLYPFGKGWVVVAMLASDHAFSRGALEEEERTLVRDLVLWAKTGGRMKELHAGQRFDAQLLLQGPEQGEASSVRIIVTGPGGVRPAYEMAERTFPLSVQSAGTAAFSYSYWIPANTLPGIHRLEYTLLDKHDRQISPSAEMDGGWFAVVPKPAPAAPAAQQTPLLPPAPRRITAAVSIEQAGGRTRLRIELLRTGGTGGPTELMVRAAGREQTVTLSRDRATALLDLGTLPADQLIAYTVLQQDGRVLARGTLMVTAPGKPGVTVDRPAFVAGGMIRVSARGMGLGAMTIIGPGAEQNRHISRDAVFESPVPAGLPTGVYPLRWDFQTRSGEHREGVVPVMIKGIDVLVSGASVAREKGRDAEARLQVNASDAIATVVSLRLAGPDGTLLLLEERTVPLASGKQSLAFSFPFKPRIAGIWHLLYSVTAALPEGPGLDQRTIVLAAGRVAIDAGDAAVIGMRLGRPLYYGTAAPAEATAWVHTTVPAGAELLIDGKRVRREKIEAAGTSVVTAVLGDLAKGRHRASVVVTSGDLSSTQEKDFLFGARLPDLAVIIRTAEPASTMLEVGLGVINQGKAASGRAQASLYEGTAANSGELIGTVPVPPLEPRRQHVVILPWSLAGKSGSRSLFAVVDPDNEVVETSEDNNTANHSLAVPGVLLSLLSQKDSYDLDDDLRYRIGIVNFSPEPLPAVTIDLEVADPSGRIVSRETISLPALPAGGEKTIERPLDLASYREGTYLLSARASSNKPLASDSLGITLLPTLRLKGSLEGTAAIAALCSPFTIRYTAADTGNVPPVNGTLKIEIRSRDMDQVVFAQQAPFLLGPGSLTVPRIDLPRGEYSVIFQGSAVNPQRGMSREFQLDRRPLTVSGPVALARSREALPRVLIWNGGEDATTIERALADKMTHEAFGGDVLFLKTVATAGDFLDAAATGLFNVYVLLEVSGHPDAGDALKQALAAGHTVIVAGSGDRSRSLAEAIGFRFSEPRTTSSDSVTFPPGSGLGLTGSLPVSGTVLTPGKKGSRPLAAFADGTGAVLLAPVDRGKAMIIPFSLIRSALHTGVSTLYSLLLRSAVDAAAPGSDDAGIATARLTYSAVAGPVKVRIVETLPPGAEVVWMSLEGSKGTGTLTFDVVADQEPKSIVYLFRSADKAPAVSGEVLYQCQGAYVSQGKAE